VPRDRFDCPHRVPQRVGRDGRLRAQGAARLRRMYPPRGGSPRRIKPFHGPLSAGACPRAPADGCWRSQRPTDAAKGAYRRKTVGLRTPSPSPGAAGAEADRL
jgi:hypothetical protein